MKVLSSKSKPKKVPPIGAWVRVSWIDSPSRVGIYLGDVVGYGHDHMVFFPRAKEVCAIDSLDQFMKVGKCVDMPLEVRRKLSMTLKEVDAERAQLKMYNDRRSA